MGVLAAGMVRWEGLLEDLLALCLLCNSSHLQSHDCGMSTCMFKHFGLPSGAGRKRL
jgi:hypothetical protein